MMRLLMSLALVLTACSGEDDAGTRRDLGAPESDLGEEADMAPAVDLPDEELTRCADGTTTGAYPEVQLEHYCLDSTGRVLSRLNFYLCTGCDGPLVCEQCDATPTHYTQINLFDWNVDFTGQTFDSDVYFGVQCRIGGGCDEIPTWRVTIDAHQPGLCAAGSYRFEYAGGFVEEGTFDASAPGAPDDALIQACD